MGGIFDTAGSGEYNDVGGVMLDLRALWEKMGVEIIGEDEILPGDEKPWEDILVVIPPHDEQVYWREIRLRESGGLDSRARTMLIPHTELGERLRFSQGYSSGRRISSSRSFVHQCFFKYITLQSSWANRQTIEAMLYDHL
jgi:hypothetical protein